MGVRRKLIAKLAAIADLPRWLWDAARDFGSVLIPSRVSLITVVLGGILLLGSDQGPEALASVADSSRWYQVIAFFIALVLWGASNWYWARIMLNAEYGVDTKTLPAHITAGGTSRINRFYRLERWTPRALGFAVFLITLLAFSLRWYAGRETLWLLVDAAICLILFCAFWFFVIWRHKWTARLVKNKRGLEWMQGNSSYKNWLDLPKLSRRLIGSVILISVASMVWACIAPANMGWYLGSGAVLFFAFALIIPVIPGVQLARTTLSGHLQHHGRSAYLQPLA